MIETDYNPLNKVNTHESILIEISEKKFFNEKRKLFFNRRQLCRKTTSKCRRNVNGTRK